MLPPPRTLMRIQLRDHFAVTRCSRHPTAQADACSGFGYQIDRTISSHRSSDAIRMLRGLILG